MVLGISTTVLVGAAAVAFGGTALAGYGGMTMANRRANDAVEELDVEGGSAFRMRPADTSAGSSIPGVNYLSEKNRERKRKKALDKGYVRWHIINDSVSKPMYVSPEYKEGGDIPELKYKGDTYLFPESAMLPMAEDGVWTVFHREGKTEPINIRDPDEDAIGANALQEYLTMRVTSQAPGGLGNLLPSGWDASDVMKYGLIAIIAYAVISEVMSGGLI